MGDPISIARFSLADRYPPSHVPTAHAPCSTSALADVLLAPIEGVFYCLDIEGKKTYPTSLKICSKGHTNREYFLYTYFIEMSPKLA